MSYRTHPIGDYRSVVGAETQFVDVRRPDEVAAGALPGTVNIPLDQLAARVGELDPARRTVLVCRSGGRSGQAAQFLAAAGFADVINLEGGLLAHNGKDSR